MSIELSANSTNSLRLRCIECTPEALFLTLAVSRTIRVNGLPDGAKLSRWYLDSERRSLMLVVEHESFSVVPPGDLIPFIERPPVFTVLNPDDPELCGLIGSLQSASESGDHDASTSKVMASAARAIEELARRCSAFQDAAPSA